MAAPRLELSGALGAAPDAVTLGQIVRRVIWLCARTGAASTSTATIATALWFAHLTAADRVSLDPHAAGCFEALHYLLGNLERGEIERHADAAGGPAALSRSCGPARRFVDFAPATATLAAAGPLVAAAVRRHVEERFGPRERSRFVALTREEGLDRAAIGSLVEQLAPPAAPGSVLWVIEVAHPPGATIPGRRQAPGTPGEPSVAGRLGAIRGQRQARRQPVLDAPAAGRVHSRAALRGELRAAGWHTIELHHGTRREARFAAPGGKALRGWFELVDDHSLCGLRGEELRKRLLDGAPAKVIRCVEALDDDELAVLVEDLAGNDVVAV
ncbi:MAG TPA: hypothetical protein VMD59_08435, partial [Acidimicrobiales bacterium]|nr:hypothetical protein [Acidimicrobiales bacterium]